MNRTRTKLPKPSKINRKLTLSKETVVQISAEPAPKAEKKCTAYYTGCLPYTC